MLGVVELGELGVPLVQRPQRVLFFITNHMATYFVGDAAAARVGVEFSRRVVFLFTRAHGENTHIGKG